MASHQNSLALIPHKVSNSIVQQRASDGYINATAMCQAVGKRLSNYTANDTTTAFVAALSADAGIPASELIQVLKGGNPELQGTWVHPDVAINLAQWLSPQFAVQVSKWVREWMSGGPFAGGTMPYHLQRYTANASKIPYTQFSVLNELVFNLIAPLEQAGYTLPDNMVPDISQGKMFAKWVRDTKGVDTDSLPTYEHVYADGRKCQAKLYPIEWLSDFRHHFNTVWMRQKAATYFQERDPAALPHLDKVLSLPSKAPQAMAPLKIAAPKSR